MAYRTVGANDRIARGATTIQEAGEASGEEFIGRKHDRRGRLAGVIAWVSPGR